MTRQVPYTEQFITPNEFFEEQEVMKKIFNGYNEENMFMPWLYRSGRKMKSKRDEFRHHEQVPLWSVGTVSAKGGGATAGAVLTATLSTADHSDSGVSSPFQVKGIIEIETADGDVRCYVTAKNTATPNAHVLTVRPIDATVVLNDVVEVGDKIKDISNAKGDGTTWIEAYKRNPEEKKGRIQIVSAKSTVFKGEIANAQKVMVPGPNGASAPHYYLQKDSDTFLDLQMRMDFQMLIGPYAEDLVDPDNGLKVSLSKSLNHYIEESGETFDYTTAPELADFDAVCDYLAVENAPEKYFVINGDKLSRKFDELFAGKFDNGAINFGKWGVGSEAGKQVDFNFKGWQYGDYFFEKMRCKAFAYKGRNTDNNYWRDTAFLVPADLVSTTMTDEEGVEKELTRPRIMVRYRESPEESRLFKRIMRTEAHTNTDSRELIYQAEAGLQAIGARLFVKFEKGDGGAE